MDILYVYTDYFQNYDILLTLQGMGEKVTTFDKPFMTYDKEDAQVEELGRMLKEHTFHMVLNYGYIPYLSDLCSDLHIPYVSWTYDSILHSLYHPSLENPYNILFVYDKSEYEYIQTHFNVPHLYHLPLAVNLERIAKLTASSSEIAEFTYDISFVGDLYQGNTYLDLEPVLSPDERAYFEQAFAYFHGQWGGDSIYDWFSKDDADYLQHRLPDYLKNDELMSNQRFFADILLSKPIAERERIDMMNRLARRFPTRLYHKPSTDISVLQNVNCHPMVNYYDAMIYAFRYSKINLNSTLHGMKSGIPLRCFDILGAGGFLLTNYQSELLEHFTDRQDLVIYHTLDEMEDLADYYLRHDSERTSIAKHGIAAIEKGHTYRHRLTHMLDTIRTIIS